MYIDVHRPAASTLSPYTTLFRSRAGQFPAQQFVSDAEANGQDLAASGVARYHQAQGVFGIHVRSPIFWTLIDRKSTRLNSSHGYISYAVFCLKKKRYRLTAREQ